MRDEQRGRLDAGVLAAAALVYGLQLFWLVSLDPDPPAWDEAVHLRDGLVAHRVLSDPGLLSLEMVRDIAGRSEEYPLLRPSGYYPPLVAGVAGLGHLAFGRGPIVAVMTNAIFVALLAVSLYAATARLFDRSAARLAAATALLLPSVLEQASLHMLDLPLTAMVALAFAALLYSDDFRRPGASILCGLCLGMGMLTKWTFAFFLVAPLAWSAIRALQRGRLGNVALAAGAALLAFGPYYFPILPDLIAETWKGNVSALRRGPEDGLFSVASLVFYPRALWDLLSPAGCALLLLGAVGLARTPRPARAFLLVSLLVPWCVFTFGLVNKQPRYMLPWLAFLLPVAGLALHAFRRPVDGDAPERVRARLGAPAVALLLGALAVLLVQERSHLRHGFEESDGRDWPVTAMIDALAGEVDASLRGRARVSPPIRVGVIPDHPVVNGQTLRYYAAFQELPLHFVKLETYDGHAARRFRDELDRYAFIVAKSDQRVGWETFQASNDAMHAVFAAQQDAFAPVADFALPDGSTATLHRRSDRASGAPGAETPAAPQEPSR